MPMMSRMRTDRATYAPLAALCWALASSGAAAQTAPAASYVVMGPQGAVARTILLGAAQCPEIELGTAAQPMQLRATPDAGDNPRFPVTVCEKPVPPGTPGARIGGQNLPLPPAAVSSITVFGDTGCRIKAARPGPADNEGEGGKFQDCNDAAQWPFRQVSTVAAASRPYLVIHVGDYLYRESPCPPEEGGCRGSPYGDDWPAWKADFFDPAQPLLAAAPWIMTRGNHEICQRGGTGYFRFLDPRLAGDQVPPSCAEQIPPYTVTAGGQPFIVLDSSNAPDAMPSAADIERFAAQFSELQPAPGSWLITHRPIWGVKTEKNKLTDKRQLVLLNETLEKALAASGGTLPRGIELVLSGHIHLWEAIAFEDKRSPQFVLGSGGTELSHALKTELAGLQVAGTKVSFARSEHVWGFTRFTPAEPEGWSARLFDQNGRPRVGCTVADRKVACR